MTKPLPDKMVGDFCYCDDLKTVVLALIAVREELTTTLYPARLGASGGGGQAEGTRHLACCCCRAFVTTHKSTPCNYLKMMS